MNAKQYQIMREEFLEETLKLSDNKRIEYTEGNHKSNVLWNFENIAKTLGLSPMKVLSVYLLKHTVVFLTISKMVRNTLKVSKVGSWTSLTIFYYWCA